MTTGKSEIWTKAEQARLDRLDTPRRVQAFLDSIPYSTDPYARTPRRVLADRVAHCFDGALFAAAALRRQGLPPLLVDLRAENDDDHVIAIFSASGRFGAVAKSNFAGLRWREPVYRTLRELAMSYFEPYYNTLGERSLRAWSVPLDLSRHDRLAWEFDQAGVAEIERRLDQIRHFPILTPAMRAALSPVDERSYRSGMLGTEEAGLFKARRRR